MQIYTYAQIFYIPSTERIKKKKIFSLYPSIRKSFDRRTRKQIIVQPSRPKGREKCQREDDTLSFLERNRLIGTDGFRDHEGAGTQNRFLHDRSINHPLLRNANAKYTGWDSAVRATGSHMCSCIVA